jgi:hypothetical protein
MRSAPSRRAVPAVALLLVVSIVVAGCGGSSKKSSRPYGVGARLHGLPPGSDGRTLLAGICLAGERLRLTP